MEKLLETRPTQCGELNDVIFDHLLDLFSDWLLLLRCLSMDLFLNETHACYQHNAVKGGFDLVAVLRA